MPEESLPAAPPARHREPYVVRWYETDPDGWATPRAVCQLLQEAAIVHAALLDVAVERLIEDGVAWVLSRLRLELSRWPRGGDEVTVETWPHAASRLLIERRFLLTDPAGELGRATSLWIVMDLERRRPIRLPQFIRGSMGALIDPEARPWSAPAIGEPAGVAGRRRFEVRLSDLDMVRHVNNAHYPQWAVESVPEALWVDRRPAVLDVHFLGECRLGDTVTSESGPADGDGTTYLHRLTRGDGAQVARATSRWAPLRGPADSGPAG